MNEKMSEGFQLIHEVFRLKWIPEIVASIAIGNNRYTDIADSIEFLSNTELNRKLALLQTREVVVKRETEGKEGYYLTEFGCDLNHIFNHFVEMSNKYIEKISDIELV